MQTTTRRRVSAARLHELKQRAARREHGVPGQLNGYVLDKDSPVTGYGAHRRVIVFHPDKRGDVLARVDESEAREPTFDDVRAVARVDQGLDLSGYGVASIEAGKRGAMFWTLSKGAA